jgi:hypothetical protein
VGEGEIRVNGDSLCRAGYGYGTFVFIFFFSPSLLRFLLLVLFSQLLRITIPQSSGCAKEKGGGGGGGSGIRQQGGGSRHGNGAGAQRGREEEGSDFSNKMSLSQNLTLAYAALVGGEWLCLREEKGREGKGREELMFVMSILAQVIYR